MLGRGCLHDLPPVQTPGTRSVMLSGVTAVNILSQSIAGGLQRVLWGPTGRGASGALASFPSIPVNIFPDAFSLC